jgi:uncharacterized protein (DUF58 family)
MVDREILKKVRRIEIRTRRLVNNIFSGEYHSVFKGRGMSFAEVREYQFGDEVRFIDWNVSARMDRPYVKVFEEEREQTLMILFDASGSGDFGTSVQTKRELMVEMAAVVAFSAIRNNDKVGLLMFSDRVEKFIPPKKGKSHVLRLIRELLTFEPKRKGTRIESALEYALHVLNRRSVVFLMSDLFDEGFDKPLRAMARRHDLVAVRVYDRLEQSMPAVGLLVMRDAETGEVREVDTNDASVRRALLEIDRGRRNAQEAILRRNRVDLVDIATGSDYVEALVRFFETRERRVLRGT